LWFSLALFFCSSSLHHLAALSLHHFLTSSLLLITSLPAPATFFFESSCRCHCHFLSSYQKPFNTNYYFPKETKESSNEQLRVLCVRRSLWRINEQRTDLIFNTKCVIFVVTYLSGD